jgi:hypothetical protein
MPHFAVFEIKPGEGKTLTLDFEGKLPTGAAFAASGHNVTAINAFSRVTDVTILDSLTPTVGGTDVSAVIENVGLAERYEVTFTLALTGTATPLVETVLVIGVQKTS